MIRSKPSMLRSILRTMRSSPPRLYTSLMRIVPDLLVLAKGWLSLMPKTRRLDAVVIVSAGGLEYRDRSREYDPRGVVSHTPVEYQGAKAARARTGVWRFGSQIGPVHDDAPGCQNIAEPLSLA